MKISLKVTKKLHELVQKYIDYFAKKQDIEFNGWLVDEILDVAMFGDYFLNFSDIKFDVETDQPKGQILEWQNHVTDHNCLLDANDQYRINYKSWCSGARYEDSHIETSPNPQTKA